MPVVCVGGIAGVGKSSAIAAARERLEGDGYHVYSVGDLMLEEGLRRGLVDDRDQLRFLPADLLAELNGLAVEALAERARSGEDMVIDSHYAVPTPDGYHPGMPDELLDRLGIDAYVVLTAEPGDVALRRSNDGTRRRDDDPLSEISRDQGEELAAARRCAEHGRAPLYVIDTTGSSPERNGDRLYELVRQVERYRPEGGAPEAAYGMC